MKIIQSSTKTIALATAVVCAMGVLSKAEAQSARRRRSTVAPAPAAPAPMVMDAPASAPAPMANVADVHHNFTFDAFVDANARITSRNYMFSADDLQRGVFIKDAALILHGDLSPRTHAVIDLPFYTPDSTTGNEFTFAQGYAQAYVTYQLSSVVFKAGQYASFFGLESNASRDRFFSQESMTKEYINPWTHSGVQAAWATEGTTKFSVLGQVANQNSMGTLGSHNMELGLQARLDSGMGYGALGFSFSKGQAASDDTNMLIQLMGGMNLGAFNFGAEVDSKKVDGVKDSEFAAMLLGAWQMNADLGLGARLELLNKFPISSVTMKEGYGIAVGPSYKLDNNFTVRADVNYDYLKEDASNAARSVFGLNLSAVATL